MSCEKYEQELFESFGLSSQSQELQNHLKTCLTCQETFDNLQTLLPEIGVDEHFYQTDEDIVKSVEAVNVKIDQVELAKVVDVNSRWKAYVPMAAAILLIVGVGVIANLVLQLDDTMNTADNSVVEKIFVSLTDDDSQELAQIELSELIDEYSTEYSLDTELNLLDEISEEEYQYLEDNLNIGEIL